MPSPGRRTHGWRLVVEGPLIRSSSNEPIERLNNQTYRNLCSLSHIYNIYIYILPKRVPCCRSQVWTSPGRSHLWWEDLPGWPAWLREDTVGGSDCNRLPCNPWYTACGCLCCFCNATGAFRAIFSEKKTHDRAGCVWSSLLVNRFLGFPTQQVDTQDASSPPNIPNTTMCPNGGNPCWW